MKIVYTLVFTLFSTFLYSQDETVLNSDDLKTRVVEINKAFNQVFMSNSTMDDVEALFANYTDDFVYIHEVYGCTYTRDLIYKNTSTRVKENKYKRKSDRYKIVHMIAGYNGIAVERELIDNGKKHLAVFEFRGEKVSKITEYWK